MFVRRPGEIVAWFGKDNKLAQKYPKIYEIVAKMLQKQTSSYGTWAYGGIVGIILNYLQVFGSIGTIRAYARNSRKTI